MMEATFGASRDRYARRPDKSEKVSDRTIVGQGRTTYPFSIYAQIVGQSGTCPFKKDGRTVLPYKGVRPVVRAAAEYHISHAESEEEQA
jgi:hypothetical protein